MTQTTTHFAVAHFGLAVAKTGSETPFRLTSLADKIGTMKSGEKAQYVLLVNEADNTVIVMLHPNAASKLIKTGAFEDMTVIEAQADGEQAGEAEMSAEEEQAVQEELNAEVEPTTEVEVSAKPEAEVNGAAVEEPKAPSKKDLAIPLVKADLKAGVARKDTIAKLMNDEVGCSKAGANTYYQNIKSGLWK